LGRRFSFSSRLGSRALLLAGLLFSINFSLAVPCSADPLPPELIPPDVTLTPNSSTGAAASTSTPAPGITSGTTPSATSTSPYSQGSNIKQPPPPPAGSSAYSGFPSPPPAGQRWPVPPSGATGGAASAQSTGAQQADPIVVIETNRGVITVRLFRQYAPKTVEAFLDMVNQGFYNGLIWHRVEPGFVIQSGCPYGNGSGLYIDPKTSQPRMLQLEVSPNVKHNMAGVVAMAHFPKNPDSASSQFYITLSPQPSLDFKYTIFGGVIGGLDVLPRIQKGDKINVMKVQQQ